MPCSRQLVNEVQTPSPYVPMVTIANARNKREGVCYVPYIHYAMNKKAFSLFFALIYFLFVLLVTNLINIFIIAWAGYTNMTCG